MIRCLSRLLQFDEITTGILGQTPCTHTCKAAKLQNAEVRTAWRGLQNEIDSLDILTLASLGAQRIGGVGDVETACSSSCAP